VQNLTFVLSRSAVLYNPAAYCPLALFFAQHVAQFLHQVNRLTGSSRSRFCCFHLTTGKSLATGIPNTD
jgi:hypothetical protein